MAKARIPETDHGITGEVTVAQYDEMMRTLRDRGWIETKTIIAGGIDSGCALEIGHGPGYIGLEWLKLTTNTTLVGLDISPDMKALAVKNAADCGLTERTHYHLGSGDRLPFEESKFDAVFTNGSLHEWSNPAGTLNEIWRVLKPGGRYHISDMRRDMSYFIRSMLWWFTRPTAIRPGLLTSIDAAYTPAELRKLADDSMLRSGRIQMDRMGITLSGSKE